MTDTRPLAAAASIVSAMAIIGLIDNFVIYIAAEAGIWQFHLTRSLMAVPLFALAVAMGVGGVRALNWRRVAARSFFVTMAMVFYFASLAVLPIAQAVAGLFTAPIFVVLISAIFLREPVGAFRLTAVAAGFAGILLVLKPDFTNLNVWTVVPVLAGLSYAVNAIATRRWCAEEDPLTLVVWSFGGLAAVSLIMLTVLAVVPALQGEGFVRTGWVVPSWAFLGWTAVQAVGAVLAVYFISRAYQLGETSYVGIFEYSLLVFVSFWAYVLRGEVVDSLAVIGLVLIVGAGTVIALRSRKVQAARVVGTP